MMIKLSLNILKVTAMVLLLCASLLPSSPARSQSFASPEDLARATHQLTIPAGPYSVVNTWTGRLLTNIPIVSWKTCGGMEVNFTLSTVSGDGTGWYGMPAHGWRHSYHSWVGYSSSIKRYQWCSPADGCNWDYSTTTSQYTRWPANPNDISGNYQGGPFTVTAKDQTEYTFSHQNGGTGWGYQYLTSIADTHGNTISLSYNNSDINKLTRVTDPNGRYLDFVWDSSASRLRSVTVRNPNGSAVTINGVTQTYSFKYAGDPGQPTGLATQLTEIDFPAPNGSGAYPKIKFTYGVGTVQVYCIKSITVYKDSGATPLIWNYNYDTTNHVTEVDGPDADEGQASGSSTPTKTLFNYTGTVTIGGTTYQNREVRDALYDAAYPNRHREVHLYSNLTSLNGFFQKFGQVILRTVGSQSTDDTTGSAYDTGMSTQYPGCYYAEYAWNDDSVASEYDATLKSFTDQGGNTWSYKWHDGTSTDNRLNIWKITNPLGKATSYAYNTRNRLTSTTDPNNHVVTNEYYSGTYDLWKTHQDPSGANLTTTYEYDTYGNPTKVTDPYGHQIQTDYDTTYHSYPVKKTDLQTSVFSEWGGYDALGHPGWSKAPRLPSCPSDKILQTNYAYDGLGRLKTTTNPDNTTNSTIYDLSCNNVTRVTDENGKIKEFVYDNFGHVKQETSYMQNGSSTTDTPVTISHCYDELGLLKWTRWNRGGSQKAITYTYDQRNRLIKETLPGSKPYRYLYKYDGAGRIKQRSEDHDSSFPYDRTLDFTFDAVGRPDQDKDGSTILADRAYFDNGQLQQVSGVNGNVQYTYDNIGRMVTCYQSYVNKTIHYVYSASPHNLTTYIRNGSGTSGAIQGRYLTEYASDGSLQYLTSPLGPVGSSAGPKTEYVYDTSAHGLLAQVNYNINAISLAAPYVKYQYDNTVKKRLWLSSLTNYRSDGSKISSFDYTFDNAGNRNRITEANGDYTDFAYDGSYRLRSETRKTSTNSQIYAYDYQYDEIDNRTKKILTNSAPGSPKTYTYTYGDNNMLTGVSGASSGTFGYDNYGNQTSRSIGGWSYGYDSRNQMTSATKTGTSISIKYDPLGRRVEKIGPSGTARYIYDGDSMIAEADGTNTIAAWYTPGICQTRNVSGVWKTFYYACDALGSTRELTNDLQQVTDAHAYNAWGEEHGDLRPDSDPNKPKNPLRFVGKSGYYSDDDLGLDLLGARYYDPALGRFITQDPSRDGPNWYEYAGSNPINNIDPKGLAQRRDRELQDRRNRGDFNSDWAGRAIGSRWLYGNGRAWNISEDPKWSAYMMDDAIMQQHVADYLRNQALENDWGTGVIPFSTRIHMEVENGEGMVGYQYLHGTNKAAGDFLITGYISRHKNGDYAFVMTYQWNDRIDPNFQYSTDRQKLGFAKRIPFSKCKDYDIHISWSDRSTMSSTGQFTSGWLSR